MGTDPGCRVKLQVGRGERESDKVALPAGQSYLAVIPEQRVKRDSVSNFRCGPTTLRWAYREPIFFAF